MNLYLVTVVPDLAAMLGWPLDQAIRWSGTLYACDEWLARYYMRVWPVSFPDNHAVLVQNVIATKTLLHPPMAIDAEALDPLCDAIRLASYGDTVWPRRQTTPHLHKAHHNDDR